jgi:hypothetical protein
MEVAVHDNVPSYNNLYGTNQRAAVTIGVIVNPALDDGTSNQHFPIWVTELRERNRLSSSAKAAKAARENASHRWAIFHIT